MSSVLSGTFADELGSGFGQARPGSRGSNVTSYYHKFGLGLGRWVRPAEVLNRLGVGWCHVSVDNQAGARPGWVGVQLTCKPWSKRRFGWASFLLRGSWLLWCVKIGPKHECVLHVTVVTYNISVRHHCMMSQSTVSCDRNHHSELIGL